MCIRDRLYPGTAPEAAAESWLARGPGLVVVTKGHDGSIGLTAGDRVDVRGMSVDVSDTVGAGDAFTSALLASLHASGRLDRAGLRAIPPDALRECLAFANRVAAITCTRAGAQPPTRTEMDTASVA